MTFFSRLDLRMQAIVLFCPLWLNFGAVVRGLEDLANLGLSLPARPMFSVQLHEPQGLVERLFPRFHFEYCIAADEFLGFDERSARDG